MKSLLAGLLLVSVLSLPASAATVTIGLSEDGGPITAFSGGSNFNITGVSFGTFQVNNVTGTAFPSLPFPELLDSQAINVSSRATSGPHELTVYVAAQGSTALGPERLLSSFTSNTLTGGWKVDETTLFSNSNNAFVGTKIAEHLFNAIGSNSLSTFALIGKNFSAIERYQIFTNGKVGGANSTINLVAATPVPAALPLFVGGLGLLGWMARRRDQRTV